MEMKLTMPEWMSFDKNSGVSVDMDKAVPHWLHLLKSYYENSKQEGSEKHGNLVKETSDPDSLKKCCMEELDEYWFRAAKECVKRHVAYVKKMFGITHPVVKLNTADKSQWAAFKSPAGAQTANKVKMSVGAKTPSHFEKILQANGLQGLLG